MILLGVGRPNKTERTATLKRNNGALRSERTKMTRQRHIIGHEFRDGVATRELCSNLGSFTESGHCMLAQHGKLGFLKQTIHGSSHDVPSA